MKQRYVIILTVLCLLLTATESQSQSWRWGARGGSASFEAGDWETVKDMATDQNGNIYVLSNVYTSGINVTGGGNSVTGFGRENVLITSYRCDGSFRWKKLIGGPNDNHALSLQLDSSGGVYTVFRMPMNSGISPNGYIDSDTTIAGKNNRTLYLVKYDTSGNYQWLKYPQPDTMSFSSAYSYTRPIDLNVDGAGNVYWLCHLPPGAYENGAFVVNTAGEYVLKYDAQGVFQNIISMDMHGGSSWFYNIKMQRDHKSGRFYISGLFFQGIFTMGGDTIKKPMFVGAFDSNGSLIWKRLSSLNYGGFYYRPVIGDSGHIYLGGTSYGGGSSSPPDTFNGYALVPGGYSCPFIVKMDSNGNNLWAANAVPLSSATFARAGLALRNNNEVILTGSHTGAVTWPGYPDTLKHGVTGGAYFTFITRFNAHTGQVLGMVQLPSANTSSSSITQPSVTVSDGRNNIFLGGELQGQININGTNYLKTGGNADWFIAKYGHDNCYCISGPGSSLFAKTYLSDSAVQFTATGFAPDDTLYWSYGDGTDTSLLTSPTHTYRDTGTFNVCLRLTNGCGDSTWCDTVRITNPCVLAAYKPMADFTFIIDSVQQQVQVTYTGSSLHDSVVYDFGDGNKVNATNHTHSYTSSGSYIICATTYNQCGSHTKCDTAEVPVSIHNLSPTSTVLIYPNPAHDVLYVDGLVAGSRIELYDITGRKVHMIVTAKKNEMVNMSYLAPGNYIIQLTGADGTRVTEKVVKR